MTRQARKKTSDRTQGTPAAGGQTWSGEWDGEWNGEWDGEWNEEAKAAPPAKHSGQGSTLAASRTTTTTLAHLSERSFASLNLHPSLLRSVREVFKYETMTIVQDSASSVCLQGVDVVAKAKTGTGKTLAFLLPALHRVLSSQKSRSGAVRVLALSPTRELAMQTAEEAKTLLHFEPGHSVMTMLGGTNMRAETAQFKKQVPLVLVATPGRLNDHLENSGLAALVKGLDVLIFDEADQLLDMGFRPAIDKIITYLPPCDQRQTLLFSATFPAQLKEVTKAALRPTHQVIDCVGAAEEASNTQVEQGHIICTFEDLFATVVAILDNLVRQPHKIIVFLPTARETGLFAGLLQHVQLASTVLEIHSRKSQAQRTKISEQFRTIQQGVLCSSDVSARGMDYPDVTFVLQVGAPSDRAQYLHRLGRTARAGREGAGLLLLCDFETYFLQTVKDLPLTKRQPPASGPLEKARRMVNTALPSLHAQDPCIGAQAYQAWLGQRKSTMGKMKWSSHELVEWANYFATDVLGLDEVPALEAKTVGMMGLKGVPGIIVAGKASGRAPSGKVPKGDQQQQASSKQAVNGYAAKGGAPEYASQWKDPSRKGGAAEQSSDSYPKQRRKGGSESAANAGANGSEHQASRKGKGNASEQFSNHSTATGRKGSYDIATVSDWRGAASEQEAPARQAKGKGKGSTSEQFSSHSAAKGRKGGYDTAAVSDWRGAASEQEAPARQASRMGGASEQFSNHSASRMGGASEQFSNHSASRMGGASEQFSNRSAARDRNGGYDGAPASNWRGAASEREAPARQAGPFGAASGCQGAPHGGLRTDRQPVGNTSSRPGDAQGGGYGKDAGHERQSYAGQSGSHDRYGHSQHGDYGGDTAHNTQNYRGQGASHDRYARNGGGGKSGSALNSGWQGSSRSRDW